jgi:hypothetical protein
MRRSPGATDDVAGSQRHHEGKCNSGHVVLGEAKPADLQ